MRKKDDLFESKVRKTARAERSAREIVRVDDHRFNKELDALIEEAEAMRLRRMHQHRTLSFAALNGGIVCMTIGVSMFAWYLLMDMKPVSAVISLIISSLIPAALYYHAGSPLKAYQRDYKTKFMPKLAKALNGLDFHPERGVSEKIFDKLAVIPSYETYKAEDCFMGTYKGVKVILSEARLYEKNKKNGMAFDGLFVLLESPSDVIEGHTIITADRNMVKANDKTRWKNMTRVDIPQPSNPEWDIFDAYSTNPEGAGQLINDRLLKELAEASFVFDNAPITAVMFGKKFIFLMIPCDKDMFEASNMYVPVTTKQHALQSKKEIEQLLEIIDVFDLYKTL